MINKLPCTYLYIKDTGVGERNHNFFKAINHLRKYNKKANITELYQEALQINKQFQEPLGETEVKTVTLHVFKKNYMSTCQRFKKYCRNCKYGSNRKPFKETCMMRSKSARLCSLNNTPTECTPRRCPIPATMATTWPSSTTRQEPRATPRA